MLFTWRTALFQVVIFCFGNLGAYRMSENLPVVELLRESLRGEETAQNGTEGIDIRQEEKQLREAAAFLLEKSVCFS